MAKLPRLTDQEIETALARLPEWQVIDGKLHKDYRFTDFVHAFGFMATAALKIQVLDHHPEWFNVYGTVKVDLTTHDSGGISEKDVQLAQILDQLAARFA
jgi:4a-hydroxytetrahydrobiopterin dehydratase